MLPWWEQENNAYFVTDCARDNGMCLVNIYFFISWEGVKLLWPGILHPDVTM